MEKISSNILKNVFPLSVVLLVTLFVISCNKGKKIPDVSHIQADLEIIRFEKEMFGIDSTERTDKAKALLQQHPDFFDVYVNRIMLNPSFSDTSQVGRMTYLMEGKPLIELYDTCMVQYDDFSEYEEGLEQAMQFMLHYFPERELPKVYTCLTEFGYSAFSIGPEILGISVEHFMGTGFPGYATLFPQYQSRNFTPKHLVSSSVEAYLGELMNRKEGNRMIDDMIHNGKKLYILDKLLPHTPDSIKLGYTAEQTKWCEENELAIWQFLYNEDLLYSTDRRKYLKYVSPSPNSPGMPEEAPGRTGNWIGWQIVKRYMRMNPNASLQDLIDYKDGAKLLTKTNYKGKS